ncbi:hypothetical protein GQ55_9G108800 [Panicum hallii var. hallii]|uniref:Uncharacterized protein n=1 Tax=Panicum hallii var. hallii TaxID=1504633 RepID=A0A2T7C1T3_9POAL|nr:hypothetical protein GQ55_9G108800 [Panicum hallii var. hallii]
MDPEPEPCPGAGARSCPHADGHVGGGALASLAVRPWRVGGHCFLPHRVVWRGAWDHRLGPRLPARGAERAPPLAQRPRHPRAVAYIHPSSQPYSSSPPLRPSPLLSPPPSHRRELAARSPPRIAPPRYSGNRLATHHPVSSR